MKTRRNVSCDSGLMGPYMFLGSNNLMLQDTGVEVGSHLRDDLTPEVVPELTHYEILGFEKYGNGVGEEALKHAYRKAVLKYHPDKTGSQAGEEDEASRPPAVVRVSVCFQHCPVEVCPWSWSGLLALFHHWCWWFVAVRPVAAFLARVLC